MSGTAAILIEPVHTSVKGRARLWVDGLYRSRGMGEFINERLCGRKDILHYKVNTLTGRVLVVFNSGNTHESIAAHLETIIIEYRGAKIDTSTLKGSKSRPQHDDCIPGGGVKSKAKEISGKLRDMLAGAEEQNPRDWHLMHTSDVAADLRTCPRRGLGAKDAEEALKRYGPNLLPEAVPRSALGMLLGQFKSLPVVLLCGAAVLSALTGGIGDAAVIMGVVAINAAIGFFTETQAEKTINSLKQMVRPTALIVRDGEALSVMAAEIVPGDLLVLRPGCYIAADGRLVESHHLSVDESALTGESMPVHKSPEALDFRGEIPIGDRANMLYMGTLVTGGQGLAVVTATGAYTEMGRIQVLVGEARPPKTPMERQLDDLGNRLVLIGGAVCGVVFLIGLLRGYGFLRMLKTSISLAVAAIPEGLPAVATTTLALGVKNMRGRKALIRHLDAVEALGSVQTVCLDKTGTITHNKMAVVRVYAGETAMSVNDGLFFSDGVQVNPYSKEELLALLYVVCLCSETEINGGGNGGDHVLLGTPTENALVQAALSSGIDVAALRGRHPRVEIRHRSENRNHMATVHEDPISGGRLVAVKGSPGEVLSMCGTYIKDNRVIELGEEAKQAIQSANERMAGAALRVLGVAYKRIGSGLGENGSGIGHEDFTWAGLVGLADPVRSGTRDLIAEFHRAGIRTVMITGDQSPTAYAIGRELDLSGGRQLEILDSTHFADMQPDVMAALSERVHVFSRVSPAHKLQIVQAIQRNGRVVAMTGDGINDGPALRAADVGIAMGTTGTDVAREVSDMVIEDDNLQTMIVAVSHGRTIYNNIRKSVHFLLATNMSEIMVMFAAMAGGMGQPLNAMQLLWINLISDIFPGLALALEPPEPDIMSRPPRDPEEKILRAADFKRLAAESAVLSAGALGAYGWGIARYGMGPQAGTMAFMSLSSSQLLHAISCRSGDHGIFDSGADRLPPNRYLTAALAGSFGIQIMAVTMPGMRRMLGIAPIGPFDWLIIGAASAAPLLINEATKRKAVAHVPADGA